MCSNQQPSVSELVMGEFAREENDLIDSVSNSIRFDSTANDLGAHSNNWHCTVVLYA